MYGNRLRRPTIRFLRAGILAAQRRSVEELRRSLCTDTKWKWKLEHHSDKVDEFRVADRLIRSTAHSTDTSMYRSIWGSSWHIKSCSCFRIAISQLKVDIAELLAILKIILPEFIDSQLHVFRSRLEGTRLRYINYIPIPKLYSHIV